MASTNTRNASLASAYVTPPPAMITGALAPRISSAAACRTSGSGTGRAIRHTRSVNNSTGQSCACACTSSGKATVTAPVSEGSVNTRIAPNSAAGNCSGRHTRSKNRETGRNASFTEMSYPYGCSNSCNTGDDTRVAKISDGNNNTGNRLIVANAAPVNIFDAPGPTDAVTANACNLSSCRAYPTATCTIACSFRPW